MQEDEVESRQHIQEEAGNAVTRHKGQDAAGSKILTEGGMEKEKKEKEAP